MSWRIIDVTEDGRYLHADRDWLVVEADRAEVGRVPLGDVQSVLVHAGYATYSHGLLLRLAAHDIPLVVCDHRHEPVSVVLPLSGHHQHAGRIRVQMESSQPLRKRIWRDLVRHKIMEQARTLAGVDRVAGEGLKKLVTQVRAGDPENIEARAARYYWPRLFGTEFRRDRDQSGLNAHLNYGYTILRSALARAIIAAGLSPALGVWHVNTRNNFCLADDLLEPFRPLVDRVVYRNKDSWSGELSPKAKTNLAGIMAGSILTDEGETDLFRVMTFVVSSLVDAFEGAQQSLNLPGEIAFVGAPQLPGLKAP